MIMLSDHGNSVPGAYSSEVNWLKENGVVDEGEEIDERQLKRMSFYFGEKRFAFRAKRLREKTAVIAYKDITGLSLNISTSTDEIHDDQKLIVYDTKGHKHTFDWGSDIRRLITEHIDKIPVGVSIGGSGGNLVLERTIKQSAAKHNIEVYFKSDGIILMQAKRTLTYQIIPYEDVTAVRDLRGDCDADWLHYYELSLSTTGTAVVWDMAGFSDGYFRYRERFNEKVEFRPVYSDMYIQDGELDLPEYVTMIGEAGFQKSPLTSVRSWGGVQKIGPYAFSKCLNLKEVTMSDKADFGVGIFEGCLHLSKVCLPPKLKRIPSSTFLDCRELKEIAIPDGTEQIKYCAFKRSGLQSISIPDSLKDIEENAFAGCSALTEVHYAGTMAQRAQIQIGKGNQCLCKHAAWICADGTIPGQERKMAKRFQSLKNNRFIAKIKNEKAAKILRWVIWNPRSSILCCLRVIGLVVGLGGLLLGLPVALILKFVFDTDILQIVSVVCLAGLMCGLLAYVMPPDD